jgi:hypothetical protein
VDSFGKLLAILERQVVELLFRLVLQKFFLDFSVDALDEAIHFALFGLQILEPITHFLDIFFHLWILSGANPLDLVFVQLLYVTNAFQHVGNVVDTPLLYTQLTHCII